MTIDVSALALPVLGAPGAGFLPSVQPSMQPGMQAGYGVSLSDLGRFESAMHNAQTRLEARPVQAPSEAMKVMAQPLEYVNNEAGALADYARAATAAGQSMSPGEMVMLSMRCQEFMFHCQLTSNMANRASDGLQQLFRQQS